MNTFNDEGHTSEHMCNPITGHNDVPDKYIIYEFTAVIQLEFGFISFEYLMKVVEARAGTLEVQKFYYLLIKSKVRYILI